MTTDDTKQRSDARRAARELELTNAAFDAMRAQAIERLITTNSSDAAYREQLIAAVKLIDTVRDHLATQVQSAEILDFADAVRAAS